MDKYVTAIRLSCKVSRASSDSTNDLEETVSSNAAESSVKLLELLVLNLQHRYLLVVFGQMLVVLNFKFRNLLLNLVQIFFFFAKGIGKNFLFVLKTRYLPGLLIKLKCLLVYLPLQISKFVLQVF